MEFNFNIQSEIFLLLRRFRIFSPSQFPFGIRRDSFANRDVNIMLHASKVWPSVKFSFPGLVRRL